MAKKVISDQQGQRKHPGKVTKIIGNKMATDGYGNIPLWVVPDKGESRMVYPNTGDHYFPEASFFTEYPRMQAGGAESTGVYIRPDKLNFNKEALPKKTKGLSVVDKKRQIAELNRQLEERDQAMYIHGLENPNNVNKFASVLDPTGGLDINNIIESVIRTGTINPSDLAGAAASIVPYGGKYIFKPAAKKLLLNAVSKQGDIEDFTTNYKKGGPMKKPNNKGFANLPEYVQKHIIANMKQSGGEKMYSMHNFSKNTEPNIENYSSGSRPFFRLSNSGMSDQTKMLPAITNNSAGNFYFGIKDAAMNTKVPALIDYQSGNSYFYQMGGPMLPQDALVMGEDLPVLQAGGARPIKRSYNPADYQSSFDRFDKTGAMSNDVIGVAGSNNSANVLANLKNLGATPHPEINGLYVKDGRVLAPHPKQPGNYVNLGYANDPKFKVPVPSAVQPIMQTTSKTAPVSTQPFVQTPVIQQPIRQPLDFGSNSGVYDPNTGTMYTGSPGASATKVIPQDVQQYKHGGSNPFNKNIASKFLDNYNKKFGGYKAPQGESLDEILEKKKIDFVNYIANNTEAAMFREGAMEFQKGFAQFGQEVNSQFGPYTDKGVPDYVSSMTSQYNYPEVNSNYGTPSNLNLDSHGDFNGSTGVMRPMNKANYSNGIANFGMATMQGINSFFNLAEANKQKAFNQENMSIENTARTTYGNRGLYDVNQGNFKPNQKTPYFKKGGQYSLDKNTVRDLLAQGYELEFLD